MQRIGVGDIRGVVGILPTPSLPGADHWDATDTVDLDETERLTRLSVDAGVDVLLTNGTFGEAATLTWPELRAFNETVIGAAAGRVPVFCGATTLNTRDTIARGRVLRDLGADGLFLGRPMWLALDDAAVVNYYRAVAEALPDLALVVYDNPGAFKGKISSAAYGELAAIPQVVAAKYMGIGFAGPGFVADLRAVDGRARLLPLAEDWLLAAQAFPDEVTACWSGDVACGPDPLLALRDAVLARDWERAATVTHDLHWALATLFPNGSFEEFLRYSIQIDRAKFEGAGLIVPGPGRPPYTTAPATHLEGGREAGRRWAEIRSRYAPTPAAAAR